MQLFFRFQSPQFNLYPSNILRDVISQKLRRIEKVKKLFLEAPVQQYQTTQIFYHHQVYSTTLWLFLFYFQLMKDFFLLQILQILSFFQLIAHFHFFYFLLLEFQIFLKMGFLEYSTKLFQSLLKLFYQESYYLTQRIFLKFKRHSSFMFSWTHLWEELLQQLQLAF